MRMNTISNRDPQDQDFDLLKNSYTKSQNASALLKSLEKEKIKLKGTAIAKLKKEGFKLTEQEKDTLIDRGIERGLKTG
jgi:hypothetical protein